MPKLSEHFNTEYFTCKCGKCDKDVKISLTLVGILEGLGNHIRSKIIIKKGFICATEADKLTKAKKDYHSLGKAADISVAQEKIVDSFRYLEEQPEVTGLGFDPNNSIIHVDLRDKDPFVFIIEGEDEIELKDNMREKYNLGAPVVKKEVKEPQTVELDV